MRERDTLDADFERTLAECGVGADTLTPAQADDLDGRGFCLFEGLVDPGLLEDLREAVEAVGALPPAAGERGQGERGQTGTRHVDPLARGSRHFDGVLAWPEVLAAAHRVLAGPFRISSLSCRDPLPGYGEQGLHVDWGPRPPGDPAWVVTAIWMLDDFTAQNGATRVVPGSHALPSGPPKDLSQPGRRHPDEQLVTGPAGSVLVFNGHLWHSGTRNGSTGSRRSLQMSFVSRIQRYHARVEHPAPGELPAAVRRLLEE